MRQRRMTITGERKQKHLHKDEEGQSEPSYQNYERKKSRVNITKNELFQRIKSTSESRPANAPASTNAPKPNKAFIGDLAKYAGSEDIGVSFPLSNRRFALLK